MSELLAFSAEDIRTALPMARAIEVMREAFAALSAGRAVVPVRRSISLAAHEGTALYMPAYLPGAGVAGLKVVAVHPGNPDRGLPMVHAVVLALDAETGAPAALLEGETLTALRTGAASGLATDLLAPAGASVAAVFGAGTQARTQLEAVCAVRPIERAVIFNRTPERAERFADEMRTKLDLVVEVAASPEALREADVVCTATASSAPVFDHRHLKRGVHINGVGSYRPDMAEVPPETVRDARIVVDSVAGCLEEAGDLLQPLADGLIHRDDFRDEIGDVVLGRCVGRPSADAVTFFKSVGNAVQDVAVAAAVLASARSLPLGSTVRL